MYVILNVEKYEIQMIVNEESIHEVMDEFEKLHDKDYELVDIIEELESRFDCSLVKSYNLNLQERI